MLIQLRLRARNSKAPSSSESSKARQADVLVEGGGSLYVFRILSESARAWVEEFVSREGFQPQFPNVLYVEHRYAPNLATGMLDAGLACADGEAD